MGDFCDWDTDWEGIGRRYKSDHKIDECVIKQRAMRRRLKNDELHFKRAKALEDLCDEPKEGEQWRIVTEKQFNAYALILHVLQTRKISELYLAVYRINEPTVDAITEMLDSGKIKKATFIISSFFNQTKKPERWAIKLKDYCDAHPANTRHCYTHNHAKVVCIKTTKNEFFVFEGSGNMSDNARVEQYIYERCKATYDFHKSWMSDLCDATEKKRKEEK